jgi:hypothetical protein
MQDEANVFGCGGASLRAEPDRLADRCGLRLGLQGGG